jgi:hypothetical protein
VHGLTNHDTDFTPRPVFYASQDTNALFSDTKVDPSIEIKTPDLNALGKSGFPFMRYGFRNRNGKMIVAYWIAFHNSPGGSFPPMHATFSLPLSSHSSDLSNARLIASKTSAPISP